MKNKQVNIIIVIILILPTISFLGNSNFDLHAQSTYEKTNLEPNLSIIVGNYTVPGISSPISINEVLKIGILCDMNHISGEHAWKGALLAAKEINEAGGILINFTTYYVGLVAEDTEEMDLYLNLSKSIQAAERMINYQNPHFVMGGSREEAVVIYQEIIMDAQIPFLGIGVAADVLCANVKNNYARYKYFFRIMPINSTSLAMEFISYILYLVSYLDSIYGAPTFNIGILREDLPWNTALAAALQAFLPMLNPDINIVGNIAFPLTSSATDMSNYLTTLDSAGAQIVIPLITSQLGVLMSQQYGVLRPQYLLVGINTFSQVDAYWDQTAGTCRYEVLMQSLLNTSITPLTVPFWNNYIMEYGMEPYYTGIGSYGAVKLLENTTIETQSFNPNTIVTQLEKINTSNPFLGVTGNLAFRPSHDLVEGWPFATSLFAQWQMDGKKVVLPTGGSIYPDWIATGILSIPYWGINNLVPAQSLPGDFSLSSDAGIPDVDGAFNLIWTNSEGADNYSLYMSNETITYVSKKHTALAVQSAVSPFPISGLSNGDYYFAVVAYNEKDQKFSNNVHITVGIGLPGGFTLSSDADDPDTNGAFELSWTDSEGADNFSVYTYNHPITEINGSLTNLAFQAIISSFPISGLSNGEYYYLVVAHNKMGDTLSNCIQVNVLLSGETSFEIPGYDCVFIYCAVLIISLVLIKKFRKLNK